MRRSRQRGVQSSLENTVPSWLAIWITGLVPGVRSTLVVTDDTSSQERMPDSSPKVTSSITRNVAARALEA